MTTPAFDLNKFHFISFDDLAAPAKPPRRVNPNSLLGLLYTLRDRAEKLDVRIAGVEKRLRDCGVVGSTGTSNEIVALLRARGSKGVFR